MIRSKSVPAFAFGLAALVLSSAAFADVPLTPPAPIKGGKVAPLPTAQQQVVPSAQQQQQATPWQARAGFFGRFGRTPKAGGTPKAQTGHYLSPSGWRGHAGKEAGRPWLKGTPYYPYTQPYAK